jgi:hypothetical protein
VEAVLHGPQYWKDHEVCTDVGKGKRAAEAYRDIQREKESRETRCNRTRVFLQPQREAELPRRCSRRIRLSEKNLAVAAKFHGQLHALVKWPFTPFSGIQRSPRPSFSDLISHAPRRPRKGYFPLRAPVHPNKVGARPLLQV